VRHVGLRERGAEDARVHEDDLDPVLEQAVAQVPVLDTLRVEGADEDDSFLPPGGNDG
jgi:hypothetical protein